MQHLISSYRGEDVADDVSNEDLLQRNAEGDDVWDRWRQGETLHRIAQLFDRCLLKSPNCMFSTDANRGRGITRRTERRSFGGTGTVRVFQQSHSKLSGLKRVVAARESNFKLMCP